MFKIFEAGEMICMRLSGNRFMTRNRDKESGEKYNKHENIENIGFLIKLNGVNIFHCGDTNPLNEKEYLIGICILFR